MARIVSSVSLGSLPKRTRVFEIVKCTVQGEQEISIGLTSAHITRSPVWLAPGPYEYPLLSDGALGVGGVTGTQIGFGAFTACELRSQAPSLKSSLVNSLA